MAKGYWVANVDITDPEGYKAYVAANAEAFRKYGARFLVRGGKAQCVEGKLRSRVVVIEFPSLERAKEFFGSKEYSKVKKLRQGAATGQFLAIEGYAGA